MNKTHITLIRLAERKLKRIAEWAVKRFLEKRIMDYSMEENKLLFKRFTLGFEMCL